MNTIKKLTADQIITINREICYAMDHKHLCYSKDKIESAIHSAFYPGDYPFHHGGIGCVAGALCYYITKAHAFFDGNKRTSAISVVTFLDMNEYELVYPYNPDSELNEFASMIEKCAATEITKENVIEWIDRHKIKMPLTLNESGVIYTRTLATD